MLSISKTIKYAVSAIVALIAVRTLNSCTAVFDDLDECPRGVEMRFVFDYNIEFANAFPRQVDCLSVFVFNSEGQLVERRIETSSVLADEDWRMTFDLPAGQYRAVALGGMECNKASFALTTEAARVTTLSDLEILINPEHVGDEALRPEKPLHDLYHGALDFTVTEGITYDKVTVGMMRDTNHIRLVLQHIDGSPVNDSDFRFEIIDDNTRLDHKNDLIAHTPVTYTPWTTGVMSTGTNPEEVAGRAARKPVQVAYAELSTSRLIHRSHHIWTDRDGKTHRGPRLRITNVNNGHIVVDIPLNNYLLLIKSENLATMDSQEFLDRVANYSLVFFLDYNNAWISVNIIVDDWTVNLEDIRM